MQSFSPLRSVTRVSRIIVVLIPLYSTQQMEFFFCQPRLLAGEETTILDRKLKLCWRASDSVPEELLLSGRLIVVGPLTAYPDGRP
jgi:hypothetical protein